jgi:hypothetical protein
MGTRFCAAITLLVGCSEGIPADEHARVRQELETTQADLASCRDQVATFTEQEQERQERVDAIIAEAAAQPPPPPTPPVLVPVRSRVRENMIGTPELQVTVRNETDETIDAFRFTAECFDRFDELQLGRIRHQSAFHGYNDDTIRPHQERALGWWTLHDYPLCSRARVVITEVHFANGDRWEGSAPQEPQPSPE